LLVVEGAEMERVPMKVVSRGFASATENWSA
jgi:hypothetical protein